MREVHDYLFGKAVEGMTAEEVLNYYRNLYHAEPNSTEHGIVANALNDILPRMILPPCKVGDTVWYLNRYYCVSMCKDTVYEAKVVRVYVEKENKLCLSIQIKNEYGTTEFPHITEIGKTVFLTKEEAEQALRGGG